MLELAFLDKVSLLSTFALSLLIMAFAFVFKQVKADLPHLASPFLFPALMAGVPFLLPASQGSALVFLLVATLPALLLSAIILIKPFGYRANFALQGILMGFTAWVLTTEGMPDILLPWGRYLIIAALLASLSTAVFLGIKKKPAPLAASLFLLFGAQVALLSGQTLLFAFCLFIGLLLILQLVLAQLQAQFGERIQKAEERTQQWDRTVRNEVLRRTLEMERINRRLAETARTDPLTGILNKAAILEEIENTVRQYRNSKFTLLLFDIDDFKDINDNEGHLAGDDMIRQVAALAGSSIRVRDKLGRYGGDEFLIVLPLTTLKDAFYVGRRLGARVAEELTCTLSIGIAVYPTDGQTLEPLIQTADEGLYQSKRTGKNTISYTGYAKE